MLIASLRWNLKMECLGISIAKMSFIVWLTTEWSETAIEICTSYSFSNSFICLFIRLFFVLRINPMTTSGKSICLSHQYVIKKMISFVDLLTIVLLFCPEWLDKTINFCFACICFYKFTQSVCYNLSTTVFKSTSIIRSSTLILSTWR